MGSKRKTWVLELDESSLKYQPYSPLKLNQFLHLSACFFIYTKKSVALTLNDLAKGQRW